MKDIENKFYTYGINPKLDPKLYNRLAQRRFYARKKEEKIRLGEINKIRHKWLLVVPKRAKHIRDCYLDEVIK